MASPAELSLDCKPHSYSLLLKSVGDQQPPTQQQQQQQQQTDQSHTHTHTHTTHKMEEYLARLEEERLKIEAFKRELPLCMQLLNNAMEASRQQLHSYIGGGGGGNQGPKPVLEQFIPLETTTASPNTSTSIVSHQGGGGGVSEKMMMLMNNHTSDKANWMVSAQLWSQDQSAGGELQQQQPCSKELTESAAIGGLNGKLQITDGSGGDRHIVPYGNNQHHHQHLQSSRDQRLPELTLASTERECEEKRNVEGSSCRVKNVVSEQQGKVSNNGHAGDSQQANNNNNNPQTNRKARRCWSPDLHRRFVNALHVLGGSQVATPKQIRELMKVDGLTNDEVKSHLQKYRLHTRRPSPSPQGTASNGAPQLVVLGGIWVPQEYAAAAAAAAAHGGATGALYNPHHLTTTTHASPHYCAAPLPHDYYHAAAGSTQPVLSPAAHHHQLHSQHSQIHVYPPPPPLPQSQGQSSPESDHYNRGGCNGGGLSESIEDGKSESGSEGENGRGIKALMVREEREESNGSEITLKF